MTKAADRARGRLIAGAVGVGLLALGAAQAQPLQLTPPAQNTSSVVVAPEAQKGARQEELEKLQAEQKKNADLTAKLKAELESIGEDRRKLNAMLLGSAASIRDLEGRQAAAEGRLAGLQASEDTVRRSLASRRAVIAEVLAALQRVGRKPPPALM